MEFKRSFDKKESLFRGAVQQELAEFLPVELRVQRPPQTVIKFFQSLKGGFTRRVGIFCAAASLVRTCNGSTRMIYTAPLRIFF